MNEVKKVYEVGKTISKGGLPIAILVGVKILLEVAKSQGVVIDEGTALTVAMSGYGAIVGFINWLKHRKDRK